MTQCTLSYQIFPRYLLQPRRHYNGPLTPHITKQYAVTCYSSIKNIY